jgi:hypothetical protein
MKFSFPTEEEQAQESAQEMRIRTLIAVLGSAIICTVVVVLWPDNAHAIPAPRQVVPVSAVPTTVTPTPTQNTCEASNPCTASQLRRHFIAGDLGYSSRTRWPSGVHAKVIAAVNRWKPSLTDKEARQTANNVFDGRTCTATVTKYAALGSGLCAHIPQKSWADTKKFFVGCGAGLIWGLTTGGGPPMVAIGKGALGCVFSDIVVEATN